MGRPAAASTNRGNAGHFGASHLVRVEVIVENLVIRVVDVEVVVGISIVPANPTASISAPVSADTATPADFD